MLSDEEIITRYFSRDEAAIAATSEKYGGLCYSASYGILRVREDAEECVCDSYLRVRSTVPPERPQSLKCYLLKIVRNVSLDRLKFLKRKKRARKLEISFSELENILPDSSAPDECGLSELLTAFLETLEHDPRVIMAARYWHLMPISGISSRYGFSQSKVKTSPTRLCEKLRKFLEEMGFANEHIKNY